MHGFDISKKILKILTILYYSTSWNEWPLPTPDIDSIIKFIYNKSPEDKCGAFETIYS